MIWPISTIWSEAKAATCPASSCFMASSRLATETTLASIRFFVMALRSAASDVVPATTATDFRSHPKAH